MWIVMTSSAHMPSSCKGRYRNVALVKLRQDYVARDMFPKMIRGDANGVVAVRHFGHHHVGKTARSAYAIALAQCEAQAAYLNNLEEVPLVERVTFGGSA
jgi:hypothetical protein